jgi:hypothetical protein
MASRVSASKSASTSIVLTREVAISPGHRRAPPNQAELRRLLRSSRGVLRSGAGSALLCHQIDNHAVGRVFAHPPDLAAPKEVPFDATGLP